MFFFYKSFVSNNTFIQQGRTELIKSDSKIFILLKEILISNAVLFLMFYS